LELLDTHVDLGDTPGAANAGDKAMTLISSALAGGQWIDDAQRLRAGATGQILGHRIVASSTLGTFLRSFTWGSVRQLDRVAGEVLTRAWAAGAGPGPWPLTIDVDSTHCQTYGLAKQGATGVDRHGERGCHPLLASVAGAGDVLHSRLREAPLTPGAARAALWRDDQPGPPDGASGPITVRADSGFYNHKVVQACRKAGAACSITVKVNKAVRAAIAAIPEDTHLDTDLLLAGRRRRRGRDRRPPGHHPGAGSRPPPPRRGGEHHPRPQERRRAQPPALGEVRRQRRLAHPGRHRPQPRPLDQPDRSWRDLDHHQDPAHPLLALPGRLTRSARRLHLHLPTRWPWASRFLLALDRLRCVPFPT
jgi:hypothetical protein